MCRCPSFLAVSISHRATSSDFTSVSTFFHLTTFPNSSLCIGHTSFSFHPYLQTNSCKITGNMGQRHQLFVIAKINGRYRNLCAIHHQWLYGHTALRRCLDILNIFGNANNRMPLQQELNAAAKKDSEFWTASSGHDYDTKIPSPFIATCLIIGASFNVNGYYHQVSIEPWGMAYNEGSNNNGKSC